MDVPEKSYTFYCSTDYSRNDPVMAKSFTIAEVRNDGTVVFNLCANQEYDLENEFSKWGNVIVIDTGLRMKIPSEYYGYISDIDPKYGSLINRGILKCDFPGYINLYTANPPKTNIKRGDIVGTLTLADIHLLGATTVLR